MIDSEEQKKKHWILLSLVLFGLLLVFLFLYFILVWRNHATEEVSSTQSNALQYDTGSVEIESIGKENVLKYDENEVSRAKQKDSSIELQPVYYSNNELSKEQIMKTRNQVKPTTHSPTTLSNAKNLFTDIELLVKKNLKQLLIAKFDPKFMMELCPEIIFDRKRYVDELMHNNFKFNVKKEVLDGNSLKFVLEFETANQEKPLLIEYEAKKSSNDQFIITFGKYVNPIC